MTSPGRTTGEPPRRSLLSWQSVPNLEVLNHELERVTRLAAQVYTTRYAAVLLYQAGIIHIVAPYGLDASDADVPTSIPTAPIHIRLGQPVVATTDDPTNILNSFVSEVFPNALFFASVPISTAETPFLGALCVCHDAPLPSFGDAQLATLGDFAALCVQTLKHNQRTHEAARAREARDQSDTLLRQSESIISALFHSNLQAIFLVDRHATIQAWNKQASRFARTFSHQPIQYGDPLTAYLPTDDSTALHKALRGVGTRSEHCYTKHNGHTCWYEVDYTPVFNHHGEVSGVSISLIDVTARHETQTLLEEREQFLSALLDASSDIIILLSTEGVIRYQNAASERVLGYSPHERLGCSAFDYIHPEDTQTARAAFAEVVRTGITPPITLRYQHANGQWLYLEVVASTRYDDQSRAAVIVNARDVSQSHAVQARLLLLEAAIQHINESIVITDANLERPGPHIVYANRGFEQLTGYRADEVIGQNPRIFQGPKTTPENRRRLREALTRNEVFHGSTTNYRKDGSEYIVEWSVRPVTDPNGRVTHYVSVQRDVTERYREEQLGNDQRAVLEMVVQNRPLDDILRHLLLLIDRQDTDLWASLFHIEQDTLRYVGHAGHPPSELFQQRSVENLLGCMLVSTAMVQRNAVAEDTEECGRCILRPICTIKPECVIPLLSGTNNVTGLFILGYHAHRTHTWAEPSPASQNLMATISRLATIVVAQRQLVERLEFQAYHDMLTGLPNRLFFEAHLNQVIERAAAQQKVVALLYIDLDRFKQINDTLGHDIGDMVLALIAERMEQTIPAGATLVRMGGDEFAAILPDLRDTREATNTAQSLLHIVQQPTQVGEHQIFLTANIGISVYPLDGDDSATLQRNADIALYRSKRRNVNGMQYFTADMNRTLRQSLLELRSLEADMHSSTIFEQLVVYYQPQIDLPTGAIIGFEALIRWNHPEHGTLSPARFIPIAEQNGMIRPIGKWVIDQTCELLATWQQQGLFTNFISVNVSAAQFAAPDFVASVEQMLHEYGLPANVLEVELTESLVFSDFELTARHLNDLQQLGVRIALDDFGTTPSTLSGLRWLPIDTLKIDKSFLRDSEHPPERSFTSYDLLDTVVKMAHNLNMKTVLEGIETDQHYHVANTLGCTRGQGYLFGKPALPVLWEPLLRQQYRFEPSA